MVVDIDTEST